MTEKQRKPYEPPPGKLIPRTQALVGRMREEESVEITILVHDYGADAFRIAESEGIIRQVGSRAVLVK